jgi:putative methyltransferase
MKIEKKNVYLFEMSEVMANQAKLPYSTGLIWSYCLESEDIKKNYNLADWFWIKDTKNTVKNIFNKLENPSVVGLASFIWNWNWNIEICKLIKKKWPKCLVVIGGWQPPMADRSSKFFKERPYFDIIVHGEGEVTFREILTENLKVNPDWSSIKGCSMPVRLLNKKEEVEIVEIEEGLKVSGSKILKNPSEDDTFVTQPRERIGDLKCMPSPYLNGLFDKLIQGCDYSLEATIESTRGCPFGCTFCEIGTKYYQKIKTQGNGKIYREIDWLAKNKILFVWNADSNFGILPEHLDIAKYLIKTKKETGYPDKNRHDWSKVHGSRVLEIAKLLYDAKMDPGITIALQSLNQKTLDAVKRKNITDGKLEEVLKKYNQNELRSYVEVILGLPEETVESFLEGVCKIMELGQHHYIAINNLICLPNTPFGDPKYQKKWGIKLTETRSSYVHTDNTDIRNEDEMMVLETNTMSKEQYKEAQMYRWLLLYGHYLGYFQYIARFLNSHLKIPYLTFYKKLMNFILKNNKGFLKEEYEITYNALNKVIKKQGPWGRVLDKVRKSFEWQFEEATAIRSAQNKDKLYEEIKIFMKDFELKKDVLSDLVEFQKNSVIDPSVSYPLNIKINHNIYEVITDSEKLEESENIYIADGKNYDGNLYEWGKEVLWWGRKLGKCKTSITNTSKIDASITNASKNDASINNVNKINA